MLLGVAAGEVAGQVAAQIAQGSGPISGVMLESFLLDGNQDANGVERAQLVHGQSITDACMSWERSQPVFAELVAAVRERRRAKA